MDTEVYCELRKANIPVEDITPGMPFDYKNLKCSDSFLCKKLVYCGRANGPCFPFQEATTRVLNMPRETTSENLEGWVGNLCAD